MEIDFKKMINWYDLNCCDVEFCINIDGREYYIITIAEADPNCHNLINYVITDW